MEYDEAFDKSTKIVLDLYNNFFDNRVDFNEYYQNCAMVFYSYLKNKYTPQDALSNCKRLYMITLCCMNKTQDYIEDTFETFSEELLPYNSCDDLMRYSIPMNSKSQIICDLVGAGYSIKEISQITKLKVKDIIISIKEIKKAYISNGEEFNL